MSLIPVKPKTVYFETISKRFVRIEKWDILAETGYMVDIESGDSIPITLDYVKSCIEVTDQALIRTLYR